MRKKKNNFFPIRRDFLVLLFLLKKKLLLTKYCWYDFCICLCSLEQTRVDESIQRKKRVYLYMCIKGEINTYGMMYAITFDLTKSIYLIYAPWNNPLWKHYTDMGTTQRWWRLLKRKHFFPKPKRHVYFSLKSDLYHYIIICVSHMTTLSLSSFYSLYRFSWLLSFLNELC